MGNNTTVLIMNDFVHEIKNRKDFPERLAQMLSSGETGDVIPGVKIIETHHADDYVTIEVGYNTASVLKQETCNLCGACNQPIKPGQPAFLFAGKKKYHVSCAKKK